MRVCRAAATYQYGKDLGDEIAKARHGHEKCHWISGETALVQLSPMAQMVKDLTLLPLSDRERQRVAKALGTTVAAYLIEYARALTPTVLQKPIVIAGSCSMFPNYRSDESTLPDNSFW